MLHYRHISFMPVLEAALKTLMIDDEPLVFNPLIGTIYADTDEIGAHSDQNRA
jgi:hypothetical protein